MKVKIQSTKKRKLSAVIHDSTKGKSKKLALLLPGFLDSKDYSHLVRLADDLTKMGFVAVRLDPTGVWESEGDIVYYTISQYLRDVQAVMDFMKDKGSFEDIVVVGHSLGGRVAILFGAVESTVSAVVNIMGSASFVLPENFEDTVVKWSREGVKVSVRDLPDNKNKKREFKVPYSFVEDALDYDVMGVVGELRKPLLLIAGEKDDLCPPELMKAIYEKANKPKELVVVEGIGHDYRHHVNEIEKVNAHVIKFLRRYL